MTSTPLTVAALLEVGKGCAATATVLVREDNSVKVVVGAWQDPAGALCLETRELETSEDVPF